jgi:hypothetical protein
MEYDFSGLCADQIEKIDKRLESLRKSFIKEYMIALNIINCSKANDNREEIKVQINDILFDTANKSFIFYTECMNKVQKLLEVNLK